MVQIKPFDTYAAEYDLWFEEYPFVFQSELAAIKMQLLKVGENVQGVEIGMGSGRFAKALGIKEGVEPARRLREMAMNRGVEAMNAHAERLPYRDMHFDFVLFVTICCLDKVTVALREAFRILKPGGSVIVAFIEKDSLIGVAYDKKRETSHFYKHATFYTAERVETLLKNAGFKRLDFVQTLFGDLNEIHELQSPKPGFGEGSFIVVKADK